jgi:UDP-glucose 4-epimerase/UDP-glucuronate decarboxylase
MKKILITGAAGFIGFHLAKRLFNENHEITIIDNLSRGKIDDDLSKLIECKEVRFINADLTDKDFYMTFKGDFDYVYHFAAMAGVKNVLNKPEKFLYVNALSTLYLLEWLKYKKIERVLFSSTSESYAGTMKEYGVPVPTPEAVNLTIDNIFNPRSTYALSKIFGESCFINYSRKYNIPFTIFRFHNIYGPRMGFAHVIPELILKAAKSQKELDVFSTEQTRAFCYIDDAIDAILLCSEKDNTIGEIINIGNSKEEIKIGELAAKIIKIINSDLEIKPLENTVGSPDRRCPDTSKLVNLTGFIPKIELEEGINLTYDWYKYRLQEAYE